MLTATFKDAPGTMADLLDRIGLGRGDSLANLTPAETVGLATTGLAAAGAIVVIRRLLDI